MQPSDIRAQIGLDKIPSFKLTDADRFKFLRTRLQDKSGTFIRLSESDVERIEIALRSLLSLDYLHTRNDEAKASSIKDIDNKIKAIAKSRKFLWGLIDLFRSLDNKQVSKFSICLYMLDRADHGQKPSPDEGKEAGRIREIYRTIKLIAKNPKWFDQIIAELNIEANRKKQDRWLNMTMDDLCKILIDREVILTRNPHSAPFGLVMDALTLVRPSITTAQIDSYLQITRQGVGKSGFGKRWGEIDNDLPKPPEI